MPSPIGHALAGLAVCWTVAPRATAALAPADRHRRVAPLTIACVAAAALPDLDLVYYPFHRTATHSLGFTLLIFIVAAAVTRWATGRPRWRIALVVAAAQGSHVLLDWLGVDGRPPFGIEAFWPFSHRWFISGWDVF